ncbi:MAG: orotate phosphoribosyltransferase [Parcubacteria group bacterium Gr01-1014_20]|nr:MAG: orotate phosphoribosyltransferase [Parcubacteria group bacterium Gr01-1014_20]
MPESKAREILASVDAVIDNDHFVYTSGLHGRAYVNKDAVYPFTRKTSTLCLEIAMHFLESDIEVVLAPAVGGVALTQWVAFHLSEITEREVLALYAERSESVIVATSPSENYIRVKHGRVVYHHDYGDSEIGGTEVLQLFRGDQLVKKYDSLDLKRGYNKLIAGKRVLVVEDILNTGGTALKAVNVARQNKGQVVAVAALCNRGGVTVEMFGVEELYSLLNINMQVWTAAECPMCEEGIPVNVALGKGREFLESRDKK